jgi:hypothetical protein
MLSHMAAALRSVIAAVKARSTLIRFPVLAVPISIDVVALAGRRDLLDSFMEDPPAALVFVGEHRACC